MNFQTLRTFYTIARCEKLTAAAQQLNLTQSALSRVVRQMEEEVGVSLFDHRRNRISLNQNGRKFFQMTEAVLGQYDNCIREIKEDNEIFSRTLTIALSAAGSRLPLLIHEFKKQHPEAWFSLKGYDHMKMEPDVQFFSSIHECRRFFNSSSPVRTEPQNTDSRRTQTALPAASRKSAGFSSYRSAVCRKCPEWESAPDWRC